MSRKMRIAYFAHSVRSDWNNGNAHFLRGLLRSMGALGHEVVIFEPDEDWSVSNLRQERRGAHSLDQFSEVDFDLHVQTYALVNEDSLSLLRHTLSTCEIVILHEWNTPALAEILLRFRNEFGFKLLFHDTHHR